MKFIRNGTLLQVESHNGHKAVFRTITLLIYINDLPTVTQNTDTKMYLYADDAKIYSTISSANDSDCLKE